MSRMVGIALGALAAVAAVAAYESFFIVDEREQAIVLQFGEPRRVVQEPGLQWKIPFIQNVTVFDRRIITDGFAREGEWTDVDVVSRVDAARYRKLMATALGAAEALDDKG